MGLLSVSDPISAALSVGQDIIDKIWPDPATRDKAKLALLQLQQSGELAKLESVTKLAQGQLEVDKAEAGSASVFVSGWRPAVGWVCVFGLVYSFVAQPLLSWVSGWHHMQVPPSLDLGTLITLLGGMLGLGGLRTAEKIKGVQGNH